MAVMLSVAQRESAWRALDPVKTTSNPTTGNMHLAAKKVIKGAGPRKPAIFNCKDQVGSLCKTKCLVVVEQVMGLLSIVFVCDRCLGHGPLTTMRASWTTTLQKHTVLN